MYYRWHSYRHFVPLTTPVAVGTMGLFAILLMVFLICSQRVSMPGTEIKLPKFTNEASTPVPKAVIAVTKDGSIFYNAEKLDIEGLKKALQYANEKGVLKITKGDKKTNQDVVYNEVVFYVDQEVSLKLVADLFDIARAQGLQAYLATSGDSLRSIHQNVQPQTDKSY